MKTEILWEGEKALEMKCKRDKVKGVTESESPDHFKKPNCTQEASRKSPYLRKVMLCTQQALRKKKRKAAATWQLNHGA